MDKYVLHNECSIDAHYSDDIEWLKDVYNVSEPGTIFKLNIWGVGVSTSVLIDGKKQLNRNDYPNLSDSQFRKPSAAITWDVHHEMGELLENTVKSVINSSEPELKCIDEEGPRYFYSGKLSDNETENILSNLANIVEDSYKSVYPQLFAILTKALSDFDKKTAAKKQSQLRPVASYRLYTDFNNGFMDDRYPETISSLDEIQKLNPQKDTDWLMLNCRDESCAPVVDKLSNLGIAYIDIVERDYDSERIYIPIIKVRSYDSDNKPISPAVSYYYSTKQGKWIPRTEVTLPSGIDKFSSPCKYDWFFNDKVYDIESVNV